MPPVISVEHLSKSYRLGQIGTGTLSRDINVWWAKVRGKSNPMLKIGEAEHGNRDGETIWALKDVNFTVEQGEALGIIGRNGAGKSTLLKILSRVTAPTSGHARVKGRIASLLEVGTGFHPDLTGRENIYLNGAILGMTRQEVRCKFNEIVDFAEIAQFIDTPVKHYSSGMYVRLAFAVAAHLDPEILLVDEVLAVGDAAFQKKCLGKMGDEAKEGRTVLFVSHNMAAIKSLCQHALLLSSGQITTIGPVANVVEAYLSKGADAATGVLVWQNLESAPGNAKARLCAVRILNENQEPISQSEIEKAITIEVQYSVLVPETVLNISISFFTHDDVYVLSSPSFTDNEWYLKPHPKGLYTSSCKLPGGLFNQGRYYLTVLLVENGRQILAQVDRGLSIDMVDLGKNRGGYFGYWGGVIRPILQWKTKNLQPQEKFIYKSIVQNNNHELH